jgi:hypothetical protein
MSDRASIWLEAVGVPKWTAATWPLIPRKWNKITLGLTNLSPSQRQKLKALSFGVTSLGVLPGDEDWNNYFIKDLCFEKIKERTETGWLPALNDICVSRAGFAIGENAKQAILHFNKVNEKFQLVNSENKQVVFHGRVKLITSVLGKFGVADFSAFTRPGKFFIRIGKIKSAIFKICEKPYAEVNEKSLYFFKCMRSGTATPAHPACFYDDAIREDTKQQIDISGGWFDASDLRGYMSMAMTSIMRMLLLPGTSFATRTDLKNEQDWGAELYPKLWCKDNGLLYTVFCLFPDKKTLKKMTKRNFFKVNNYWTDNKPGTADDRTVHTPWKGKLCHSDVYSFHVGTVAAGAHYSALNKTMKSQSVLKHAERHFQRLTDEQFLKKTNAINGLVARNITGNLALKLEAAVSLWRATQNAEYLKIARKLARNIIKRQRKDIFETRSGALSGFFMNWSGNVFSQSLAHEMPAAALAALLNYDKELSDELYFDILNSLKIYAEHFIKIRNQLCLPFNLPFDRLLLNNNSSRGIVIGENKKLNTTLKAVWSNRFMSGFIGVQSYECQYLAGILNDLRLEDIATGLLRWQLGENPFNVNMMADFGSDFKRDIFSTALGYIPGMMANCEFKNGKTPLLPLYRQYHHNEIYTQTHGPYQAALLIQNNPTLLTGKLLCKPLGKLQLKHTKTNISKKLEFNEELELKPMFLKESGIWKILCAGKVVSEFKSIAGQKLTLVLNPNGNCKIKKIICPNIVEAGKNFTCKFELYNYSSKEQKISLKTKAINLQAQQTLEYVAHPGKNILKIKYTASKKSGQIFALALYDAKNRGNNCLSTGCIKSILGQTITNQIDIAGDFPNNSSNWIINKCYANSSMEIINTKAYNILQIKAQKNAHVYCKKQFSVKGGNILKLAFEINNSQNKNQVAVYGFYFYDASGKYLRCIWKTLHCSTRQKNEWRKINYSYRLPENFRGRSAKVFLGVCKKGVLQYKNITIQKVSLKE